MKIYDPFIYVFSVPLWGKLYELDPFKTPSCFTYTHTVFDFVKFKTKQNHSVTV